MIVLVEDSRHQQFVFRYLRQCGLESHMMRLVAYPAGAGSGEHWVRKQFALEVQAYRRRRAHAGTALIVVIDADNLSVQDRLAQLDHAMDEAKADPIRPDAEQIARLVPKRNIETWPGSAGLAGIFVAVRYSRLLQCPIITVILDLWTGLKRSSRR